MKIQSIINVVLIITAGILIFYIITTEKPKEVIQLKRDTILIEFIRQPINIKKAKARLFKKSDSIISFYPFVASLDTIIQKDSIKIDFNFPENDIDLIVKSKVDTLKKEILTEKKQTKPEFSDYLPSFLLGLITGLLTLIFK